MGAFWITSRDLGTSARDHHSEPVGIIDCTSMSECKSLPGRIVGKGQGAPWRQTADLALLVWQARRPHLARSTSTS
jgi:hypothetical protein